MKVIDFDLHYGDGTSNTFSGSPSVSYFHPEGNRMEGFLEGQTMPSSTEVLRHHCYLSRI